MSSRPRSPNGLEAAGRKLWTSVVEDFELADHELAQLEEACRIRDTINALRDVVAVEGYSITSPQGVRVHPAVSEIRNQQLALARVLATLKVPGIDDDLPRSRGVRGFYGGGGQSRRRPKPADEGAGDIPAKLMSFRPEDWGGDDFAEPRFWDARKQWLERWGVDPPLVLSPSEVNGALDSEPFDPSQI